MIGKTLGSFTLEAQIGKGGMGEVYRAKDQKLGRDVAIKVLPEEFAKDVDRVARFQREAKLLASLNHPNIAAIYGLEEADGTHFLVLELIEGDTLADRLKRGAIPVEETLKLALQIAEALEAAHERGVIHRDLKPANIKVTPEGKVKVLDFGLAKAFAGDQSDLNLSNSPTLSEAVTMQGVILGTAAYMPPEQAKGKSVDKKADIWAFGVVLFEMLSGRTLFTGETVSETLASVIKSEPEWKSLPPNLHPRILLLLERCLEKEPNNRYSGVSDARVDIQKVLEDPSGVFGQPVTAAKPHKMQLGIPLVAVISTLCIIIALMVGWNLKPSEPRQIIRFYHELPHDQEFTRIGELLTAVSVDGTKIVYVANRKLYLRHLDELTTRSIQGTDEDPANPFFSPDGQSVGYYSFAERQWKRIPISGGAPVKLCDAPDPNGATWGTDGTILFAQKDGVIMSVSENGGTAEPLLEVKEGEQVYGPQALPGGEWVLFTFSATGGHNWDEAQIVVQSLKTGERKVLESGGSDARYVPTGHIVYALGNDLLAFAFDTEKMEKKGGATAIVEGVQRSGAGLTGAAHYSFSDTGILTHVVGGADALPKRSLVWVDREGKKEPIAAPPDAYTCPRISPDGMRVALQKGDDSGNYNIHIWNLDRENMQPLTFDRAEDDNPLWTPDGKRIVFSSEREGGGIYWKRADGTGTVENLGSVTNRLIVPYSWSGDEKTLVFVEAAGGTGGINVGAMSMDNDHKMVPLLQENYQENQPQVSPDGKWMAYTSNESGEYEVYVRPFPDIDSGLWRVSTSGGASPLWSPDGKELFYLSNDGAIAVSVETEPTFETIKSEVLFEESHLGLLQGDAHPWDIHPDGKRFLMIQEYTGDTSTEETSRPKINIVLNWFEELKERVPVD
jgi:serine/threonine protein kinase